MQTQSAVCFAGPHTIFWHSVSKRSTFQGAVVSGAKACWCGFTWDWNVCSPDRQGSIWKPATLPCRTTQSFIQRLVFTGLTYLASANGQSRNISSFPLQSAPGLSALHTQLESNGLSSMRVVRLPRVHLSLNPLNQCCDKLRPHFATAKAQWWATWRVRSSWTMLRTGNPAASSWQSRSCQLFASFRTVSVSWAFPLLPIRKWEWRLLLLPFFTNAHIISCCACGFAYMPFYTLTLRSVQEMDACTKMDGLFLLARLDHKVGQNKHVRVISCAAAMPVQKLPSNQLRFRHRSHIFFPWFKSGAQCLGTNLQSNASTLI